MYSIDIWNMVPLEVDTNLCIYVFVSLKFIGQHKHKYTIKYNYKKN